MAPSLITVTRTAPKLFVRTPDVFTSSPTPGNDRIIVDNSTNAQAQNGTLGPYTIPVAQLSNNKVVNHAGTITDTFDLSAGGNRTLSLSGQPLSAGSLMVVIERNAGTPSVSAQLLTPGTDYTVNVAARTVTLNASVSLPGKVVVNYATETLSYFGGEPVLDPFTHQPVTHQSGDPVLDPFTGNVVLDPFGQPVTHHAGDPVTHVAGDPTVQQVGDIVRYLGGEPVLDEQGHVVLTGSTIFTHDAGQAMIHNRGDRVYDLVDASGALVPLTQTTAYTPATFTLAGGLGASATLNLASLAGFGYQLKAGDRVNVTLVRGSRIVNLSASEFSVDVANNRILLTPSVANRSTVSVTVKVTIATPAFHQNGDPRYYFGDEALQAGQPVVDSLNNLVRDDQNNVVLYTAATIKDSRGRTKYHRRGEPVFTLQNGTWAPATYTASDPKRYLGNEPVLYLGGEPVFASSSQPVQTTENPHRITLGPAMGGDILFDKLEDTSILLGNGADLFTILGTHDGTTSLGTGGGNDRIAVRAISGATTIQSGSGNDTIGVGSFAGLWETSPNVFQFLNVNGKANDINALLTIDGGSQGTTDQLTVDDTGDSLANVGDLTFERITGIFGPSGSITYGNLEDLRISLGTNGDLFTIHSTHTGTTELFGGPGDDLVAVKTTDGVTTVNTESGNDTIGVGDNGQFGPGGAFTNVDGTLNQINQLLTIDGGSSTGAGDRLIADDSGDPLRNFGELTSTRLILLGMGGNDRLKGIAYHALENLLVVLGSGDDVFTIQSTHAGFTQLDTRAGVDTVNVRATTGTTTINTGNEADVINTSSAAGLPATATLTDPIDGGKIGRTDLNSRGTLDVTFRTFGPDSLDPATVDGDEFTLSGPGASGVTIVGVPVRLVRLPDGSLVRPDQVPAAQQGLEVLSDTFRYRFNGGFAPGDVFVTFVAGSWLDRAGQGSTGGSSRFLVETPTAVLSSPTAGQVLDASTLNAGSPHIDVTFHPTTGNTLGDEPVTDNFPARASPQATRTFPLSRIPTGPVTLTIAGDATTPRQIPLSQLVGNAVVLPSAIVAEVTLTYPSFSINGDEIALSGPNVGAGLALNGTVTHVSGTTYRYGLTGSFLGGQYTVSLLPGMWRDSAGNLGEPGTARFTTEVPTASLADPADGQVIDASVLNARHTIDVTFTPTSDSALLPGLITDPNPEFTLSGPGAVSVNGAAVLVSGTTYRYTVTGTFADGQYTVHFLAGSFADDGGSLNLAASQSFRVQLPATSALRAVLANPPPAGTVGASEQNGRHAIEITFFPASGATLNESSIAANLVTLHQSGHADVVPNQVTRLVGNTFRFSYPAAVNFAAGLVTVDIAGGWTDSAGHTASASTASFTVEVPRAQIVAPASGPTLGPRN